MARLETTEMFTHGEQYYVVLVCNSANSSGMQLLDMLAE